MHQLSSITTIVLFLATCAAFAQQSFEGYLIKESDEGTQRYPIWLSMQEQGGKVDARYFYKKVGTTIALEGEQTSSNITLRENSAKGKLVGTFTLTNRRDSLTGNWKSADGKKKLGVSLYPVDGAYEQRSVIPKPDKLFIGDDYTFLDALKEYSEPGPCNEKGEMPKTEYWFARRGIAVLAHYWSSCGTGYQGYNHYVFDCSTGQSISLEDELDPKKAEAFVKFIYPSIQEQVVGGWNETEEEGKQIVIESMTSMDDEKKPFVLEEYIQKSGYGISNFNVTEQGIVLESQGIFELPQATRAFDVGYTVVVPFRDLQQFLKPGSILSQLRDM